MAELDLARLKRVRSAVDAALKSVSENTMSGLPSTYNTLRKQVIDSVPAGLREEVEELAPEVSASSGGPSGIIKAHQNGLEAHARLAALNGWLAAVIEA